MLRLKKLIKKIKKLELNKGKPFNSINLKKTRLQLTDQILSRGVEQIKVDNYIIKVSYTNKDKSMPYIQIFTTRGYERSTWRRK